MCFKGIRKALPVVAIMTKQSIESVAACLLLPTKSLTAESWPFFFVHTYFPLLALSATLCSLHSMSNIVFTSLVQGFRGLG